MPFSFNKPKPPPLGGMAPTPGQPSGGGYSGPGLTREQGIQKPTAYRGFGGGGPLSGFGRTPSFGGARTFGNMGSNVRTPPPAPPPPARGSESGPGILESWFNQRATGTDPAFDYGLQRGMEDLGNRYSAAGAFNSGAARRGESDLYANLLSQRMGQLDALAGGASGEHQNRLDSQFRTGLGLAGGQAGLAGAYDLAAGGAMSDANKAILAMYLNKAGVDQKSQQQGLQNLMGLGSVIAAF